MQRVLFNSNRGCDGRIAIRFLAEEMSLGLVAAYEVAAMVEALDCRGVEESLAMAVDQHKLQSLRNKIGAKNMTVQ